MVHQVDITNPPFADAAVSKVQASKAINWFKVFYGYETEPKSTTIKIGGRIFGNVALRQSNNPVVLPLTANGKSPGLRAILATKEQAVLVIKSVKNC